MWAGRDNDRVTGAGGTSPSSQIGVAPRAAAGQQRWRIAAALRLAVRRPYSAQALRDLLFCLMGVGFGLAVLALPYAVAGLVYLAGAGSRLRDGQPQPAAAPSFLIGVPAVLVVLLVLATPIGRRLGAVHRALSARLLHEQIAAPAPVRPGRGAFGRIGSLLRDGPGWRAIGYSLLKVPLAVLEGYAAVCWLAGAVNMSYPFWWRLFRNHPPDVQLSPVPAVTPFGAFHVATFPGTFVAMAAGVAMLLAAPWLAQGASRLDLAAMRGLLGPGRLAARMHQLQVTRARAVDETAAVLRRLERDLHDGAQIRLATMAMNLGMATEKLGAAGPPPDLAQARDLIAAAHRDAKDALTELRDLVRGIHPPVLDSGLPDALSTLASASAIPVTLTTDLSHRPAPAIETIAYFCTAELLANAAKHSHATRIDLTVTDHDGTLTVQVTDDGTGGAQPGRGTGLAGLADRISTVDGRLDIVSPAGGPSRITVRLPRHT
jgi:signal transduction histidine kinase